MSEVYCEGWWEEVGFGRQPMERLCIQFDGGDVSGSGTDIIGPFTFTGKLEQGRVVLVKQYIGQHSVDYLGTYDGEGTMHGVWRIESLTGAWLIKIVAQLDQARTREIQEWAPN